MIQKPTGHNHIFNVLVKDVNTEYIKQVNSVKYCILRYNTSIFYILVLNCVSQD